MRGARARNLGRVLRQPDSKPRRRATEEFPNAILTAEGDALLVSSGSEPAEVIDWIIWSEGA